MLLLCGGQCHYPAGKITNSEHQTGGELLQLKASCALLLRNAILEANVNIPVTVSV